MLRSKQLLFFFLLLLLASINGYGQRWTNAEKKEFAKKEDSLKKLSALIVFGKNPAESLRADSNFVRAFVRALRMKNSFHYPFDSVAISKLYAPDSSFRIFTWQWKKDEYVYLQKGAIQVKTPDGSLKLLPLFDRSMFTEKPMDSIRNRENWIGAIYYKIIMKSYQGKKYYTLLGFDDFSIGSNKKWMEVLTFNSQGEPVFGGPFFSFKEDSVRRPDQVRFSIEYKKEARAFFNYDEDNDIIVFDHLISESDEPDRKETYIPIGDYEGFQWKNGQWVHIDKVFNFKLKEGEFPMEERLMDESGNSNQDKLNKSTEKNLNKKPPEKKTPPKKSGGG